MKKREWERYLKIELEIGHRLKVEEDMDGEIRIRTIRRT